MTSYTAENGATATLTQTGTTTDHFRQSRVVDPATSETYAWTSTSHTEVDGYSFTTSWSTTETDAVTGDTTTIDFTMTAGGSQSFANSAGDAAWTGSQSLSVADGESAQVEFAHVEINLATLSASGLSHSATTLTLDGQFSWSMHSFAQQDEGADATDPDWMDAPVNFGLGMKEGYSYTIAGQSSALLTHDASGTESTSYTTTVTPEGGSETEVAVNVDADVDFHYTLATDDGFSATVMGLKDAEGAESNSYSYLDSGSLDESIEDNSAVTVTSSSENGTVYLATDNNVDQTTHWNYGTEASGGATTANYSFGINGSTEGSVDVSTRLILTSEVDEVTYVLNVGDHSVSNINEDTFSFRNESSVNGDAATATIIFTASQNIDWSGGQSSAYSVNDESDPDSETQFTAASDITYSNGQDELAIDNQVSMTASAHDDGTGSLLTIGSFSTQFDSSAEFSGGSSTNLHYVEPGRHLAYTEYAGSTDTDGQMSAHDHETSDSQLSVNVTATTVDGEDALNAETSYEQTSDFDIGSERTSTRVNLLLTGLSISNDTSEAGRALSLSSISQYEETVDFSTGSGLHGGGTLSVSDSVTSTDGFTPPDPEEEPDPSTTAVINYDMHSVSESGTLSTGTYTMDTTVEFHDSDHRDPGNTADVDSMSSYSEFGDITSDTQTSQGLFFNSDGTIVAIANSSDSSSRTGEFETGEEMTVDVFFTPFSDLENRDLTGGAIPYGDVEANYGVLLTSPGGGGTRANVNSARRSHSPEGWAARAAHTETSYSDSGTISQTQSSSSGMRTTATPDAEVEGGFTYRTQGHAEAASNSSDITDQYTFSSATHGTILGFTGDSGDARGAGLSMTPDSPSSLDAGTPAIEPAAPAGISMGSFVLPSDVYVASGVDFSDSYDETGSESTTESGTSTFDINQAGETRYRTDTTSLYQSESEITASTDRAGNTRTGASALSERSTGNNSVLVYAVTHSHGGGSQSASMYNGTDHTHGTLDGSDHVFESSNLPDHYAYSAVQVDTFSHMQTIGFHQAAGEDQDILSAGTADYSLSSSETYHAMETDAVWTTAGVAGHYFFSSSTQSGSVITKFKAHERSKDNRPVVASTGSAIEASFHDHFQNSVNYAHSNITIDDNGDVTTHLYDHRTTDHGQDGVYERTDGGDYSVTGYLTYGGTSDVEITTDTAGGWLTQSPSGGLGVASPTEVHQQVTSIGTSAATEGSISTDGITLNVYDRLTTVDTTLAWRLDYVQPEPGGAGEGEEGGGEEDTGLTFTVTSYSLTKHDQVANTWAEDDVTTSSAGTYDLTDAYIGDNQYHEIWLITGTQTDAEGNTSSGSFGNAFDGPLESSGFQSGFAATLNGHDRDAWIVSGIGSLLDESSGSQAPRLNDTFDVPLEGPMRSEEDTHGINRLSDKTVTPVQDGSPHLATVPWNGDASVDSADDDYFDQTGDWVGDWEGDNIRRACHTKTVSDVSDYDNAHPEATPADWDAFFAGSGDGTGLSLAQPGLLRGSDAWNAKYNEWIERLATAKKLRDRGLAADADSFESIARSMQGELGLTVDVVTNIKNQRAYGALRQLESDEAYSQSLLANPAIARSAGVLQAAGGAGQTVGTIVVISGSGLLSGGTAAIPAAVAGGWLVFNGVDNFWVGATQIWTGEFQTTLTQEGIQSLTGAGAVGSAVIEGGMNIVAGGALTAAAKAAKTAQQASAGAVCRATSAQENLTGQLAEQVSGPGQRLAGQIATIARTRPIADRMKDVVANPSKWKVVRSVSEASTNIRNKGGWSLQELLRNEETGETLVRHTLFGADGTVFELPHFRQLWK